MNHRLHTVTIKRRYVQSIQFLYLVSIASTPIYFGGERILAWGITGVAQSIILIALAVIPSPPVQTRSAERYVLMAGLLCLGLVLTWGAIQLLPITPDGLVHPIWGMTSDAIGETLPTIIAVSPDEGFLTLIKVLIVLLAFFNAKKIYLLNPNLYTLILAISFITLTYAIVGLIWLRYFPGQHFWLATSPYQKNLVSTFVNRNSFAQYLGIGSLAALAYITHVWKNHFVQPGSFSRIQFYLKDTFNVFAFSLMLFCTLLTCLLLTASRGGIYSSLAAYAIFFLAMLRFVKDRYVGIGVYFVIAIAAGYFSYDSYSVRVGERNLDISDDYTHRFELYRLVWELIQNRPLTGYGLGGFEAAFRAHIPVEFDPFGVWHRAHNVYLDTAVALGIPAAIGALFVAATPLIVHILRMRKRISTISILVIALYVQISIHSLFDFGLQTGANAITVAAILGASLTEPRRRRSVNQ